MMDSRSDSPLDDSRWVAERYWKMKPLMDGVEQLKTDQQLASASYEKAQEYSRNIVSFHQLFGHEITDAEELASTLEELDRLLFQCNNQKIEARHMISSTVHNISNIESSISECLSNVPRWYEARAKFKDLIDISDFEDGDITSISDLLGESSSIASDRDSLIKIQTEIEAQIGEANREIMRYKSNSGSVSDEVVYLATLLDGKLLSEYFDDLSIEDSAFAEAEYGHLREAIVVSDIDAALNLVIASEVHVDDLYLIQSDLETLEVTDIKAEYHGNFMKVVSENGAVRLSEVKNRGVFGSLTRKKMLEVAEDNRETLKVKKVVNTEKIKLIRSQTSYINILVSDYSDILFAKNPELVISSLETDMVLEEKKQSELEVTLSSATDKYVFLGNKRELLQKLIAEQEFFDLDKHQRFSIRKRECLEEASQYIEFFNKFSVEIKLVVENTEILQIEVKDESFIIEDLKKQESLLREAISSYQNLLYLHENRNHFDFEDAKELLKNFESSNKILTVKHRKTGVSSENNLGLLKSLTSQLKTARDVCVKADAACITVKLTIRNLEVKVKEQSEGFDLATDFIGELRSRLKRVESEIVNIEHKKKVSEVQLTDATSELKVAESELDSTHQKYSETRVDCLINKKKYLDIKTRAVDLGYLDKITAKELSNENPKLLAIESSKALGVFSTDLKRFNESDIISNYELSKFADVSSLNEEDAHKIVNVVYEWTTSWLMKRISCEVDESDDPYASMGVWESTIEALKTNLEEREETLGIKSNELVRSIRSAIRKEQSRLGKMNALLHGIQFGSIRGIKIEIEMLPSHQKLLEVLSDQDSPYQKLFEDEAMSLKQVLGKIFTSMSDTPRGDSDSFERQGNLLLDYRKYLRVTVKINKGAEKWEVASSDNISTGEAIGTGVVLMLMIIHSWEVESSRVRSKQINPARFLPLDEASRLDEDATNTLNELCLSQGLQMMIAQPQGVTPKSGMTHLMKRTAFDNLDALQEDEVVNVTTIDHNPDSERNKDELLAS